MHGQLTASFVKNIKKPGVYSDKNRTGLRLRVLRDGRKHWVQRFTIQGRRREAGLGSYPIVTLSMARNQALANKRMIYEGFDPIEEKRNLNRMQSFSEAVEEYLESKLKEFRNEKHKKQWRSSIDNYAVPIIGTTPIQDVNLNNILDVLRPIWETKTETASRLRQRLEAVLSWAIATGLRVGPNPAIWKGNLSEILPKPSKIKTERHHAAVSLEDAPRFWQELQGREGMGSLALKFLCLTAARSGEVRGMTWNEIDLENRIWTIPKERMKANREHRIPLPDAAVQILQDVPHLSGCYHVFFSPTGKQLSDMSISAVLRRMDENAVRNGTKRYLDKRSDRPAVPHGLRSTFRDWAAEQGIDHVLAELALAHTVGNSVERAYRRTDMVEKRRDILEQWAGFLGA